MILRPRSTPNLALLAASASLAFAAEALGQDYFETWPAELQTDVTQLYKTFGGEIAIYIKDLSTGARYTHNSATPMYLASGVKIPIMVELFRQIHAHDVSLDDEVTYGPEDVRDGAPVLSYVPQGTPVKVQLLLDAMINQSDNSATDMILRHIGITSVNKGLVKEGIFGFGPITTLLEVRRLVYKEIDARAAKLGPFEIMQIGLAEEMDTRLTRLAELLGELPGTYTLTDLDRAYRIYYRSGNNSAPLDAMGTLLEGLAKGRVVSPGASKQMLEILMKTETGPKRIRAGLPIGTAFVHKTGTQYRRICDFGIFQMAPERSIVIAVCVKNAPSIRKAEEAIAYVAQRAYGHMVPADKRGTLSEIVPSAEEDADNAIPGGGAPGVKKGKRSGKVKAVRRPAKLEADRALPDLAEERGLD